MTAHPLPITVAPLPRPGPPVFLADPLLNDPADLPHRGVGFDEDIHVAEALPVQERKAFPDTKFGLFNEIYVRLEKCEINRVPPCNRHGTSSREQRP